MTRNQINLCLKEVNEVPNNWTTLENSFSHITIECDNFLHILPQTTQFYFDDETELLLIRHTHGKVKKVTENTTIPRDHVTIMHDGIPYMTRLEGGGCDDITVGRFHEALSYEMIIGLCKVK